jgi:hypothetical protein
MARMTDMLAQTAGSTRVKRAAPAVSDDARGQLIGSHQPTEVKRQFDILAAELGISKENLHAEALNNLFAKYGKPELCPFKKRKPKKKEALA